MPSAISIEECPYFSKPDKLTTQLDGGEFTWHISAPRIVVWLRIKCNYTLEGLAHDTSEPFPAILDTGLTENLTINEEHLARIFPLTKSQAKQLYGGHKLLKTAGDWVSAAASEAVPAATSQAKAGRSLCQLLNLDLVLCSTKARSNQLDKSGPQLPLGLHGGILLYPSLARKKRAEAAKLSTDEYFRLLAELGAAKLSRSKADIYPELPTLGMQVIGANRLKVVIDGARKTVSLSQG